MYIGNYLIEKRMKIELYEGQLSLVLILTGLSLFFILLGFIQMKFPPKQINGSYGYRTKQSMYSDRKWHFAQQYSAKWFIVLGLAMLVCILPFFFFAINPLYITISNLAIMVFFIILSVYFTEKKMKEME